MVPAVRQLRPFIAAEDKLIMAVQTLITSSIQKRRHENNHCSRWTLKLDCCDSKHTKSTPTDWVGKKLFMTFWSLWLSDSSLEKPELLIPCLIKSEDTLKVQTSDQVNWILKTAVYLIYLFALYCSSFGFILKVDLLIMQDVFSLYLIVIRPNRHVESNIFNKGFKKKSLKNKFPQISLEFWCSNS